MAAKFAKIKPNIWFTKLKEFSPQAKLLAIYMMTNERFQMVGIYRLTKHDMKQGTALPGVEVDRALEELCNDGFCHYDAANEFVWVVDMARTQVSDGKLSPQQQKGVINELTRVYLEEHAAFVELFFERYANIFRFLPDLEELYFE